jgi:hypothetical protein
VYDPPMTFTILSGRWVGNTGCPAKSSTKGGHPNLAQWRALVFAVLSLPVLLPERELQSHFIACYREEVRHDTLIHVCLSRPVAMFHRYFDIATFSCCNPVQSF